MTTRPEIAALLTQWAKAQAEVLADALTIQRIPAPTFSEGQRAAWVGARFDAIGLHEVQRDEVGNVYGHMPGSDASSPALMVSAHLDTVFSLGTDLAVRHDPTAGTLAGPGIGDNSLGVAAMLRLAEALVDQPARPPAAIWWVATVGEEGLGDLRGMRRACDVLAGQVGLVLVLEGIGLGRIFHAGMGVRRLKVTVRGPGGHSWLHAGRPSAIHHLLRIGAALVDDVTPARRPRSALNIGLIEGGTSINTLAAEASLSIDLRSVDGAALDRLERSVRAVVERVQPPQGLTVTIEVVGDRPSAALPANHPLVQAAQHALRAADAGSITREVGSTDANIPLSRGIPAICVGITTGGEAHTVNEYIHIDPVVAGMRQITLLTLLAAEHAREWSVWSAPGRGE